MHRFPEREARIEDGVDAEVLLAPRQPCRGVVHPADHSEAADGGVNAALEQLGFAWLEEAADCHIVTFEVTTSRVPGSRLE